MEFEYFQCAVSRHTHTNQDIRRRDLMFHIGKKIIRFQTQYDESSWTKTSEQKNTCVQHFAQIPPVQTSQNHVTDGSGWSGVICLWSSGVTVVSIGIQTAYTPEHKHSRWNRPFQKPPFFSGYVSFREGICTNNSFDGRNPAITSWGKRSLSHDLQRFYTSQVVGNGISEPSTVPSCFSPKVTGYGVVEMWCLHIQEFPAWTRFQHVPGSLESPIFSIKFANGGNFKQRNIQQNDPSRLSSTNQLT